MRPWLRRVICFGIGLPVFYVVVYVVLSVNGEYRSWFGWSPKMIEWPGTTEIGELQRLIFEVTGKRHPSKANLLGWFFAPLVELDRRWWHRDEIENILANGATSWDYWDEIGKDVPPIWEMPWELCPTPPAGQECRQTKAP